MSHRFGQKVAASAACIFALMAVSPLSAFAQSTSPSPISSIPLQPSMVGPSLMETQTPKFTPVQTALTVPNAFGPNSVNIPNTDDWGPGVWLRYASRNGRVVVLIRDQDLGPAEATSQNEPFNLLSPVIQQQLLGVNSYSSLRLLGLFPGSLPGASGHKFAIQWVIAVDGRIVEEKTVEFSGLDMTIRVDNLPDFTVHFPTRQVIGLKEPVVSTHEGEIWLHPELIRIFTDGTFEVLSRSI